MRWTQHHFAVLTVLETEEHRPIALNASCATTSRAFFPDVLRLDYRHPNFLSARTIHLFAHDVLDLLQDTLAQRQVTIHACCQLTDKASTYQQFLVATLRVSWHLAQRFWK